MNFEKKLISENMIWKNDFAPGKSLLRTCQQKLLSLYTLKVFNSQAEKADLWIWYYMYFTN
jgi:hypothetical protein